MQDEGRIWRRKGEGLNPGFPAISAPKQSTATRLTSPLNRWGKQRLTEEEGLLREQHGGGGRAENKSRAPDTHTPTLPCQVLLLQQKLTQELWRGCQGTCLEVLMLLGVAINTHRAQVSTPHPHVDPSGGLGWTVFPKPKSGLTVGSPWGPAGCRWSTGEGFDSVLLWSRALFCLTSIQQGLPSSSQGPRGGRDTQKVGPGPRVVRNRCEGCCLQCP